MLQTKEIAHLADAFVEHLSPRYPGVKWEVNSTDGGKEYLLFYWDGSRSWTLEPEDRGWGLFVCHEGWGCALAEYESTPARVLGCALDWAPSDL